MKNKRNKQIRMFPTQIVIHAKILDYLDNFYIIKLLYQNTFIFDFRYYKYKEEDTTLEINLQIGHIIKIIQSNRMDILDSIYIHMKQIKFVNVLLSFCILYGTEEMLEELIKRDYTKIYQNWMIEKYIIGLELIFFKLRNHLYGSSYFFYLDKMKIWFDIMEYPNVEYYLKEYYKVKSIPLHYKYYLHFENRYKNMIKEDKTFQLLS